MEIEVIRRLSVTVFKHKRAISNHGINDVRQRGFSLHHEVGALLDSKHCRILQVLQALTRQSA